MIVCQRAVLPQSAQRLTQPVTCRVELTATVGVLAKTMTVIEEPKDLESVLINTSRFSRFSHRLSRDEETTSSHCATP